MSWILCVATRLASLIAATAVCGVTLAEPPSRPVPSFAKAKAIARDVIYKDRRIDLYCGCTYTLSGKSGGKISNLACGYEPRKNATRGKILEWEHIVPAWFFGHSRACWKKGDEACIDSKGRRFKGRRCCVTVDEEFQRIEADLHNLAPSVGELNGDRSNKPYGIVDGERRDYGRCNFEINWTSAATEPPDNVRGDVARVWLYMSKTYGVAISPEMKAMFDAWSQSDPVDDWERTRDQRIEQVQGNRNEFVRP